MRRTTFEGHLQEGWKTECMGLPTALWVQEGSYGDQTSLRPQPPTYFWMTSAGCRVRPFVLLSVTRLRRSVVCKALIAWIMTHKLLSPFLVRSLQVFWSKIIYRISNYRNRANTRRSFNSKNFFGNWPRLVFKRGFTTHSITSGRPRRTTVSRRLSFYG